MAPEWMVDVPEDLPSCWSVVARPAGVRCLVTTGGGETRRHAKGCAPRRFPSALPGGRRAAGGAGHVQLDCVWAEAEQTYYVRGYVLDLLAWKGLRLMARELAAAPDKAARWRPGETEAALPIGALLAACEGAMEADSGAAAGR
ncbi:hypothetical protein EMIHUDRAFT_220429 [Emiliania huxleyi CCMP1516]|uniref:Snurportin-1 n=2 Tax=Emiliania huxleyi TaxID=2903 RepID=A0A0D3I140_EMIH1|nr:hypothetical protein EMIHUDRAFT_220429 [Emiliania huxleyi CCMP1516]EOD04975.1 hypothetical protein EMIHUDRAFT_220429 [Emiliania huxleyi CCMP1516]|eukprot:XP_005757404.1 hypothetical protein EMIHUDRAFT_220429 [Emiliania huxleyi CCMP1516]